MKIAFISDLHVDNSPHAFALLDVLYAHLINLQPDVFIIAGDIAAPTPLFEKAIHRFACLPCHKLLVPGNHDIWIDSLESLHQGIHSGVKYTELIPAICERHGFHCLGASPRVIDGTGFAGTIGWYDYSLRNKLYDSIFSPETYRTKRYGDRFTWSDVKYAYWQERGGTRLKSDAEVAAEMESALQEQLVQLEQQGVARTVVVTHHVPFREMIFYPQVLPFDFFSAYMGSEGLGAVIAACPTVCQVICGHSHIKSALTINGLTAAKSPLGYYREWRTADRSRLVEDRVECVEII